MFKEIIPYLRCPICKNELILSQLYKNENDEIIDGLLGCDNKHQFAIKDGVADFNSIEQEHYNNWSTIYEDGNTEEIDQQISERTPQNQKDLMAKALDATFNIINETRPAIILDIATGRGAIPNYLTENPLQSETCLICTDLSYTVLRLDRLKLKKVNPQLKINYIACDCSNIPIKSKTIDLSTSIAGIPNMVDKAVDGIKEAHRILKSDKVLLSTTITIDENQKSKELFKTFKQQYGEMNIESVAYRNQLISLHQNIFLDTEALLIGTSIGEENELDLIPLPEEKFYVDVLKCKKRED